MMCYSARVRQNLDHLSRRYDAEVEWEAFEELYRRRAEGEDIRMSRDLQRNFQHPHTEVQRRTAGYIAQYLKAKKTEWETEVFAQKRRVAEAVRAEIEAAGVWDGRIVTEIADLPPFYPAEAEHHDYFTAHPGAGYCRVVIAPKVAKFRKQFADRLKQGAA